MAGLLGSAFGWQDNPWYKGFDQNRQAITNFGVGLGQGVGPQEGLRYATAGLAQGAALDQEERRRQEDIAQSQDQKNATAAYLRANGRDDLAQAIESGFMDAQTAFNTQYQESHAQADPVKGIEINGRLVNPITGEEMGNFSDAQGGVDPKAAFDNESALWKQYMAADPVSTYQTVKGGYEKVRTSAAIDSGPGDVSLILDVAGIAQTQFRRTSQ